MIFFFVKLGIWLVGLGTVLYFVLPYAGYQVNLNYWKESRAACEERLQACQRDLIKTGLEGAKEKCDWKCMDTRSLIQKIDRPAYQPSTTGDE